MRTVIFILLLSTTARADAPKSVHKDGGIISMGAYQAKEPKSLNEIPEPARSRIVAHLKQRLGDPFFHSLELSGGQIVDLHELRRKEPDSKRFRWEVPAYRLLFEFRLPNKGIEYYEASIDCRRDGSVINEIDLPEIAKHPNRAIFVSLSDVTQTARANGFDVASARVEIRYHPKEGKCVYRFAELVRRDGPMLFFRCADIDAHSGKLMRIYEEEAIT